MLLVKKILKHLDKAYNTLTDNKNRRAYLQLNSPIDSFQTLYHNLFQKYEEPLSTINRLLGNIPQNTNSINTNSMNTNSMNTNSMNTNSKSNNSYYYYKQSTCSLHNGQYMTEVKEKEIKDGKVTRNRHDTYKTKDGKLIKL